jgi:polar amino acid transport system permease protein
VLGIVTILAISMANWSQIQSVFFRGDMIHETLTQGLPNAFKNTIVYTLGAFVFGLVLGTMLALMRLSSVGPYRWIATTYIEFFRGLPAIVVFIAFGLLPLAFNGLVIPFDPYGTVWIALGLVGAAYMAETIRAGIQAVPKGQVEAARSLGMPTGTATRKIVLPQAFRIITPPLTNELILLVKDSSLVYILGLSAQGFELTKYGRAIANTNANLTPLVIAGFCYLLITLPLSMVVRRMEARQKKER